MNGLDWVTKNLISAAAINNEPLDIKRVNSKIKFSIYQSLERADRVLIDIKSKIPGSKVIQMLKLKYEDKRSSVGSKWIKKYFEYRVDDEFIKTVFAKL